MLIDRLDVAAHDETSAWPFSVPAVRDVATRGLTLTSNFVVLIDANDFGKSLHEPQRRADVRGKLSQATAGATRRRACRSSQR